MSSSSDKKPKHDTEPNLPADWSPGKFDYERLDAFRVAREALQSGDAIAKKLPRGYGKLRDQLTRALLGAYTQVSETASRSGQDRVQRCRIARAEASEAAAALDAVVLLGLQPAQQVAPVIFALGRLCAMLTRLGKLSRQA